MGLTSVPGAEHLQYFSFYEEVSAISAKFFKFIIGVSPGWFLLITAISLVLIIVGVIVRFQLEIKRL